MDYLTNTPSERIACRAVAPKGTKSYRTQGGISVRRSICLSACFPFWEACTSPREAWPLASEAWSRGLSQILQGPGKKVWPRPPWVWLGPIGPGLGLPMDGKGLPGLSLGPPKPGLDLLRLGLGLQGPSLSPSGPGVGIPGPDLGVPRPGLSPQWSGLSLPGSGLGLPGPSLIPPGPDLGFPGLAWAS